MKYIQKKLKNNLETVFINAPGSTSATVQIWFKAGSALEDPKDHGIAHFLEHMFFKGTAKRPGASMTREIESFGGEINAFTSFDYTCYYINTPQSYLKKTTEILLDMVSNPQFLEKDITPEVGVVYEEYRRSLDNPSQFSFNQLQKSSFKGAYSHMILGNPKTIKSFSRSQLIQFRKKFYNSSNAFLVIAGDLDKHKGLEKTISQFRLPKGPLAEFPEFKLKAKATCHVHQKEVKMAELTISIQAPKLSDPLSLTEDLAINCLGAGETSPLYKELVIKSSLANSASASTMFMTKGGVHFFRVRFPYKHLAQVSKDLLQVIKKSIKGGFQEEDIKKIKNHYLAAKIFGMESLESFAFTLGHSYTQSGDIAAEEEFLKKIKTISTKKVNHSLSKIFSRSLHLSLQIPKEENKEMALESLKVFQSKLEELKQKSEAPKKQKYKITKSKYDPQVQLIELKKGLSLLYRKNPLIPTFILQAYIKGGITRETPKTNGCYHLITQLLTKGHQSMTYEKLKQSLEDKSSSLTGFSGKNAYGLNMHGLSQDFSFLSDIFINSLLGPSMEEKCLNHEKEIAKRSLENQIEDPIKACFSEVSKSFFTNHPYSYNLLGTEKNINTFSNTLLKSIHQKNINKNDILITYCGDQELSEVLDALAPMQKTIKTKTLNHHKKRKIISKQNFHKFIYFDREQTQIFYGIPAGPIESYDHVILKMLTTYLSGQSSELFLEVRDRQGLCYAIQPVHFIALEAGYWGIYMACGNEKVHKSISAIRKILDKIQDKGLSRSHFLRIKKMIEGQNQISIQTNDDYASVYSVPALQGYGLDYYHKSNESIKNLGYTTFQKRLAKILSSKWNSIIVGKKDIKKL